MQTYHILEIDGPIATLRLNRIDALNALSPDLITEVLAAVEGLEAEHGIRALVLASNHPKAWVAGADIKAMQEMAPLARSQFSELGHSLMAALERASFITVAAVNGVCLGGGFELALACDLIYAGPKALWGFPEVTLGLVPGFGGTQRFARSVGMHRALGYILSARRFGNDEAKDLGYVWRFLNDDASFLTQVVEDVSGVIQHGPLALAEAKKLVREATHTDLATGSRLEIGAFGAIGASEDAAEGLAAFLGKRKPEFSRR